MEITTMTNTDFFNWYTNNKGFDWNNPHIFTDYRIIKVIGTRHNGEPYTDYHVAFKWDGNENWTNFVSLWNYRGEWLIGTNMRDDKWRFERVCDRAGVKAHKRYDNFTQAAKDYIKIVKADHERFNERFN